MKKLLTAIAAMLVLLLIPAAAPAKVIEVGRGSLDEELAAPSCPKSPCYAISRTTGYQAKVGTNRGLMQIPADGRIVAWTVRLSKPGPKQIQFFNDRLGGKPQAGLSILRPGKRLFGRVIAQSPIVDLDPFLGQTAQFPLETSIAVKKGSMIGLTVPTWAPALADNLGSDTSWRASRPAGQCDDTSTQTAQVRVRDIAQYRCLYQKVRLAYSATLITDPVPNPDTPAPATPPADGTQTTTTPAPATTTPGQ